MLCCRCCCCCLLCCCCYYCSCCLQACSRPCHRCSHDHVSQSWRLHERRVTGVSTGGWDMEDWHRRRAVTAAESAPVFTRGLAPTSQLVLCAWLGSDFALRRSGVSWCTPSVHQLAGQPCTSRGPQWKQMFRSSACTVEQSIVGWCAGTVSVLLPANTWVVGSVVVYQMLVSVWSSQRLTNQSAAGP